jgi:hypothetical protein
MIRFDFELFGSRGVGTGSILEPGAVVLETPVAGANESSTGADLPPGFFAGVSAQPTLSTANSETALQTALPTTTPRVIRKDMATSL